jgi:hypothetical protein
MLQARGLCSPCNRKSEIYNRKSIARVAELADAPDLGFRNRRFQNVSFRFKKSSIYEGKRRFSAIGRKFTTDDQKRPRSSTNSSTRTAAEFLRAYQISYGFRPSDSNIVCGHVIASASEGFDSCSASLKTFVTMTLPRGNK